MSVLHSSERAWSYYPKKVKSVTLEECVEEFTLMVASATNNGRKSCFFSHNLEEARKFLPSYAYVNVSASLMTNWFPGTTPCPGGGLDLWWNTYNGEVCSPDYESRCPAPPIGYLFLIDLGIFGAVLLVLHLIFTRRQQVEPDEEPSGERARLINDRPPDDDGVIQL